MATTRTAISNIYTQVATSGAWVSIQFVGTQRCDVIIGTPLDENDVNELGLEFRVLDAMTPDTFGDGDVWIKTRQKETTATSEVAIVTS